MKRELLTITSDHVKGALLFGAGAMVALVSTDQLAQVSVKTAIKAAAITVTGIAGTKLIENSETIQKKAINFKEKYVEVSNESESGEF